MKGRGKGGWIVLWRSVQKTAALQSYEPACPKWAWVDLLLLAASGGYDDLAPGQVRASVRFMAQRWRWSRSKAERFRRRLIRARMVRPIREEVLEIVNWKALQSFAGTGANAGMLSSTRDTDRDTKRDTDRDTERPAQNGLPLDPETPIETPIETAIETKTTKGSTKGSQPTDRPPVRDRRRKLGESKLPHVRLLGYFCDVHEKTGFGPYDPTYEIDQRILRTLCSGNSEARLREMVDAFFVCQKWVQAASGSREDQNDPKWPAGKTKLDVRGMKVALPHLKKSFTFENPR